MSNLNAALQAATTEKYQISQDSPVVGKNTPATEFARKPTRDADCRHAATTKIGPGHELINGEKRYFLISASLKVSNERLNYFTARRN